MDYSTYRGRGKDKITGELRPISYLPNVSEWVGRVYCLEDESDRYSADDVLGGLSGIDNAQAQALANRTYFLKDGFVRLAEIITAMQLALEPTLTTIKNLAVQELEITDYKHQAWMGMGSDPDARSFYSSFAGTIPRVSFTFSGGSVVNPIIEISLENGKTFFIRTDGKSVIIPSVDEFLDLGDDQ